MRIESERWVQVYFYTRTLAHFMNSAYALLNVFIFEVSNKIPSKFLNIISSQLKKILCTNKTERDLQTYPPWYKYLSGIKHLLKSRINLVPSLYKCLPMNPLLLLPYFVLKRYAFIGINITEYMLCSVFDFYWDFSNSETLLSWYMIR